MEYVKQGNPAPSQTALAEEAEKAQVKIRDLVQKSGGTESIAGIRTEMASALEKGAGIYRSADTLEEACATVASLRQRYAGIELHDKSNVYNTDLVQALELGAMLDCAEAVTVGARERKESRGAHQRLDFTERDDQTYLKHSLAYYHPKEPPHIDYLDVVITKTQPGVRDYSGAKK
jgi:fumarate reductase flavoprotein subunit